MALRNRIVETMIAEEDLVLRKLRENAERCRRLARQVSDRDVAAKLNEMAEELDARAAAEARNPG
jgi:predicted ATP-grasp superfamily ATP-dependent carboligase